MPVQFLARRHEPASEHERSEVLSPTVFALRPTRLAGSKLDLPAEMVDARGDTRSIGADRPRPLQGEKTRELPANELASYSHAERSGDTR